MIGWEYFYKKEAEFKKFWESPREAIILPWNIFTWMCLNLSTLEIKYYFNKGLLLS